MIQINQPSSLFPQYGRRIAYGRNINGNSAVITPLTLDSGITLAKALPSFAIIRHVSGDFTLGVVRLEIGSINLSGLVILATLAAGSHAIFNTSIAGVIVDTTAALAIEVTTISGGVSSFSIDVFGFVYA